MPEDKNPVLESIESLEAKGFARRELSGLFFKRGDQLVEILHDGYVWMH